MSRSNRPLIIGVVVLAAALVVVLGVVMTRSDDPVRSATGPATTTGLTVAPTTGPTTSTGPAGTVGDPATGPTTSDGGPQAETPLTTVLPNDPTGPFTTPNMPLEVAASNTKGLSNGQTVRVRVRPKDQAQVFGAEARLCAGDARVERDPDFRPSQGGKCIARPLAADTDSLVGVPGVPPYQEVQLAFRVGVGTDTFTAQDGRQASITCGPANPCQLVLKLQYPNGFGFQSLPVTYG